MTFSLPKELKQFNSLAFELLLPIDINDLDVDRLITTLMELAVKQGRTATSKTDASQYEEYLSALQAADSMIGFDDDRGRDVLDGWLRTSVVKLGQGGRGRSALKMDYVRPLTLGTYRSGLPISRSRNRRADDLIYHDLIREVGARGAVMPQKDVAGLFQEIFGTGVDVGAIPWATPRYDEVSKVDINALLALRFLERFEGSQNVSSKRNELEVAVPGAVQPIGRDLLAFLQLYGPMLPASEAISQMSALLSVRLFQLPLRTAIAARGLLEGTEPSDVGSGTAENPLELFCDFTQRRGGPSDELARQCVQRDLDRMRTFFGDRILLRSLHQALALTGDPGKVGELPLPQQMAALAGMKDDPQIQIALRMQIQQISAALSSDPQGGEGLELIAENERANLAPAEALQAVLVEALRKNGLKNQVAWFWTTAGVEKPYGLIAGTRRARSSWRYAPTDELLSALLCMCFVEQDGSRSTSRLPIAVVLRRLNERFGILIDRPPRALESADARSGAAENLQAFTRQLQLIGCFQGLSDDFTAQFVSRPRESAA